MLILSLVTIASNITYLLSEGGGASPLAIPSKDADDEDYEEYILSEDQMAQLLLEGAPERSDVVPAWQDTREELPIRWLAPNDILFLFQLYISTYIIVILNKYPFLGIPGESPFMIGGGFLYMKL